MINQQPMFLKASSGSARLTQHRVVNVQDYASVAANSAPQTRIKTRRKGAVININLSDAPRPVGHTAPDASMRQRVRRRLILAISISPNGKLSVARRRKSPGV